MKLLTVLTLLATAAVSTAQGNVPILKACTEKFLGGDCPTVGPDQPPLQGIFNSYGWPGGRSGHCAQFCNDCAPLGYACETGDNGGIAFNKAFVYQWTPGSDGAPCC